VRAKTFATGEAAAAANAQALVAFYVDCAHAAGVTNIPAQRRARVGQQLKRLADEGIPSETLERALRRMVDRNAQPSLLPDLVVDVQSPPPVSRWEHPVDRELRTALDLGLGRNDHRESGR
jgi:hypothetical protein